MRLLTSPAWLQADRAGSRQLVATTTWRVDSRSARLRPRWLGSGLRPWVIGIGQLGFEVGVPAGLADQQRRQAQAEAGVGQAEEERLGRSPARAAISPVR